MFRWRRPKPVESPATSPAPTQTQPPWALNRHEWGYLMSTMLDLQSAVARQKAEIAAASQAITELLALVASLKAAQGLSADEQAALDVSVADVTSGSDALSQAAAAAEAVVNPPAPAAEPVAAPELAPADVAAEAAPSDGGEPAPAEA